MIITFISLTLLGLWTGVLSLFNSMISWNRSKKRKTPLYKSRVKVHNLEMHPKGRTGKKNEFAQELRELWCEIIYGH